MAIDTWTQALCAVPPVFCGRRLRPFSLSHSVILRGIGNPYAYREAPAVKGDLLTALFVCHRNHKQNTAALFSGRPLSAYTWFVMRWGWRVRFDVADANLREYLADFTRAAQWGGAPSAGGEFVEWGAPDEFHMVRVLCSAYGYAAADAWDVSYGLARAYYDAHCESEGARGLMTPYDIKLAETLKAEADARAAGDMDRAKLFDRAAADLVAARRARAA